MQQLGDRIKSYEQCFDQYLTPNSNLIIRVDGKAFHTYTRGMDKPFDISLRDSMNYAARETASHMSGFKLAYGQSDEYTFLLNDLATHETQGWFGYRLNKLVSVTASLFTGYFNEFIQTGKLAFFDARAFIVPEPDVPNVFVWRQRDWHRNSVSMYARSFFSHKQLMNKSTSDIHEMLHMNDKNWAAIENWQKNGSWILPDKTIDHSVRDYEQIAELLGVENG